MNLLELRRQFGGAAVVTGAKNKIEQLFERGRVARGPAQNGFEQADSLLGKAVAGKQVDVSERLRDKFLGLIVQLRIGRRRLRSLLKFRAKAAHVGTQLGSGSLGYVRPEVILG